MSLLVCSIPWLRDHVLFIGGFSLRKDGTILLAVLGRLLTAGRIGKLSSFRDLEMIDRLKNAVASTLGAITLRWEGLGVTTACLNPPTVRAFFVWLMGAAIHASVVHQLHIIMLQGPC